MELFFSFLMAILMFAISIVLFSIGLYLLLEDEEGEVEWYLLNDDGTLEKVDVEVIEDDKR